MKHDSTGTIRMLFRVVIFKSALYIFCRLGAFISITVRLDTQLFNPGQLFLPLPFEFTYIFCV